VFEIADSRTLLIFGELCLLILVLASLTMQIIARFMAVKKWCAARRTETIIDSNFFLA
jgi:hypothetical protein